MIGPLIGLFVATFILMKKHGFNIFEAISTKGGNEQQKPHLAEPDLLELQGIVVDEIHEEEHPDQGRSKEYLPSVET